MLYVNFIKLIFSQVDYGPANETTYCEKLKTNLYRKKPHQCINYHLGVRVLCNVTFYYNSKFKLLF